MSPTGSRTGRLHLVSDVPGRHARLNREAHEALVEAMGLCARADRLRADVSRIVAVSTAAGGHGEGTDHAVAIEQLVALIREAAGLLGQATWFWAQTMDHEASSDPYAPFEWVPAAVSKQHDAR